MTDQTAIALLHALKLIDLDENVNEAIDMATHALMTESDLKNALYERCRYNCNAGPVGMNKNGECMGFFDFFSKDAKKNLCLSCPLRCN